MAAVIAEFVGPSVLETGIAVAASRISDKSLSPVALTEMILDRIGKIDSKLLCYVTVLKNDALKSAANETRVAHFLLILPSSAVVLLTRRFSLRGKRVRRTAGAGGGRVAQNTRVSARLVQAVLRNPCNSAYA